MNEFYKFYTKSHVSDFMKQMKYSISEEKMEKFIRYHTEEKLDHIVNDLHIRNIWEIWIRWCSLPSYKQ